MNIKNILVPLSLIFVLSFSAFTSSYQFRSDPSRITSYSPKLKVAISKLEQMPEVREFIAEVQSEGPVKVEIEKMNSFDFEALWDANTRTVFVNENFNKSTGELITSILFELHNAKSNKTLLSTFELAKKGLINKETYVRNIEKMEHGNAVNTTKLLEKGIARGIFPKDSSWNIYKNFEDHYKLQQVYGHSQWLADRFDQISPLTKKPFQGSIPQLNKLTQNDKDDLARYLSIKNKISSSNRDERLQANEQQKQILKKFNFCKENSSTLYCKRYLREKELFQIVFNS